MVNEDSSVRHTGAGRYPVTVILFIKRTGPLPGLNTSGAGFKPAGVTVFVEHV